MNNKFKFNAYNKFSFMNRLVELQQIYNKNITIKIINNKFGTVTNLSFQGIKKTQYNDFFKNIFETIIINDVKLKDCYHEIFDAFSFFIYNPDNIGKSDKKHLKDIIKNI